MKTLLTNLVFLATCVIAQAGGPDLQIDKARIEEVQVDARGIVLRVSGIVTLDIPHVDADKDLRLPMNSAEISWFWDETNAPSHDGMKKFEERLKAMKGTEHLIQVWASSTTIEDGKVARITGRLDGSFIPQGTERRFTKTGS